MKITSLVISFSLLSFFGIHGCRSEKTILISNSSNKVRLFNKDTAIVFYLSTDVEQHNIKLQENLFYAWFAGQNLHYTKGATGGKPLHGPYIEYFPNGSLKTKGAYRLGLRNGIWEKWNEQGNREGACRWRLGVELDSCGIFR